MNPKILKFLIFNTNYLLKVTKFLGKISQFEFLVITKENIFAYKLFLSLNISDFNLFFMWKLQPPWKKSPPLSQQPPLKVEVLSSPPLFKIWLEAQPLPPHLAERGCTLCNFDWDWQNETWVMNKVITYSKPRTLEFKSCPLYSLWPESSTEVWLTDRQAEETGKPNDKHVGGSKTFETSYT